MFSRLIAISFLALFQPSFGCANEVPFTWLDWFNSTNSSVAGIGTDQAGNIYVSGSYLGSVKVERHSLPFAETSDIFVAKLTHHGKPIWVRRMDSGGDDSVERIVVGRNGAVFLYGTWGAASVIDKTHVRSGPFVARNDQGRLSWSEAFATEEEGSGFRGLTLSLKDRSLWVLCSRDGRTFLKNYSTDGTFVTNLYVSDGPFVIPADVAVNEDGNVFITGTFFGVSSFGRTNTFDGHGGYQFTAAFDSSGSNLWLWIAPAQAVLGGSPNAAGTAIQTTPDGGVVSVGGVRESTVGAPYLFAFVAKHSADGRLLWMQTRGEHRGGYLAFDVAVDSNNNVFMTGSAFGYLYNPASRGGVMIIGYDSNGTQLFEQRINSVARSDENVGTSLCVDAKGNLTVAGFLTGSPIIGTNVLPSRPQSPFVARVRLP